MKKAIFSSLLLLVGIGLTSSLSQADEGLQANCVPTDGSGVSVKISEQPWGSDTHQFIVTWENGGRSFAYQFIGDEIQRETDKRLDLKETTSVLWVFCRAKYILHLDKQSGEATLQVKVPNCSGIELGDGPHFPPTPQNFKVKLTCSPAAPGSGQPFP